MNKRQLAEKILLEDSTDFHEDNIRAIVKRLSQYESDIRADERDKFNKYGRKYNKYPKRMLKSKHRYHVRVGKKFENCSLCSER